MYDLRKPLVWEDGGVWGIDDSERERERESEEGEESERLLHCTT